MERDFGVGVKDEEGTKPSLLISMLRREQGGNDKPKPCLLHDCVSLGNVEKGLLETSVSQPLLGSRDHEDESKQKEEVKRLPLLLRILSNSRPLATVSWPESINLDDDGDEGVATKVEDEKEKRLDSDEILENAVRRLEDRAAVYSASEDVEAISCHLAPYVCRRISKLPPCRRAADGTWEIADLVAVAHNPSSSRFQQQTEKDQGRNKNKRRKIPQDLRKNQSSTTMMGDELYESDDYDDTQELEMEEEKLSAKKRPTIPKRKRLVSSGTGEHNSTLLAAGEAEDSQEAFVTKTLAELALVVTQYLEKENQKVLLTGPDAGEKNVGSEVASMEESILAQARVVTSLNGIIGSDLGATVASLFHHATVLRHSHTASALCQAGQPQTPQLLERLASNCPAGIPSLVRGCLKVVQKSDSGTSQHKFACRSIYSISETSRRERQRIRTMLRLAENTAMANSLLELQLELALDQDDPVDLACFLIRHLSCAPMVATVEAQNRSDRPAIRKHLPMDGDLMDDIPAAISKTVVHDRLKMKGVDAIQDSEQTGNQRSSAKKPECINFLASVLARDGGEWIPRVRTCLEGGMGLDDDTERVFKTPRREGKVCLLLRAYLWVLSTQEVSSVATNCAPSTFVQLCTSFAIALDAFKEKGVGCDTMDNFYCLLLSCMLLSTTMQGMASDNEHKVCLQKLFTLAATSRTKSFVGCVTWSLQSTSAEHRLRCFFLKYLGASPNDIVRWQSRFPEADLDLRKWCQENLDLQSVSESALAPETLLEDPSVVVVSLETSPSTLPRQWVEAALEAICLKASVEQAASLISLEETFLALAKGSSHLAALCSEGSPMVPLVPPLKLEMQAYAFLKSCQSENVDLHQESAKFLLQLVYSFLFREYAKGSPFAFEPTTIPLKEVWLLCDQCDTIATSIRTFLFHHVEESAPEAAELGRYIKRIRKSHLFLEQPSIVVDKEELKNKLRLYVSSKAADSSGSLAEKTFLHAMLVLSEKELVCTTISSMLTAPKSPPLFLTYSKLCEDPLVMMKSTVSDFWSRPGLRRVATFVLSLLLHANTALLRRASRGDESTLQEFMAARDLLTVRCLVTSATESKSAGVDCSATISLTRWILASHPGLSTCLLRQGLQHLELEWLVNVIPEVMVGSSEYPDLLLDEATLNPVERLTVAESLVRMVVLYGHRDEYQSQRIMQAALSTLVSGFFLVLGPSGVSVSALLPDNDSNINATYVSRQAAMGILSQIGGVRGFRRKLRSECAVALQKLYRMCKGEELVGGLSVAVGARQKNALREILDAVTRSMSSIGIGGM